MTASLTRPVERDPAAPVSPPALRGRRPSWRDPRLAVGVLLVAGSVLAGATLVGGDDGAVAVLAARAPLAAGQAVTAGDLASVSLRFTTQADAARYLPGDAALAPGSVVTRPVGAGELVPRSAVSAAGEDGLVEVPLALDSGRVPVTVSTGERVDVWVTAATDRGEASGPAERVLRDVAVLATTRSAGPGSLRQVVVGVPVAEEDRLPRVLSRLSTGSPLLVRRADRP